MCILWKRLCIVCLLHTFLQKALKSRPELQLTKRFTNRQNNTSRAVDKDVEKSDHKYCVWPRKMTPMKASPTHHMTLKPETHKHRRPQHYKHQLLNLGRNEWIAVNPNYVTLILGNCIWQWVNNSMATLPNLQMVITWMDWWMRRFNVNIT